MASSIWSVAQGAARAEAERIRRYAFRSVASGCLADALAEMLSGLTISGQPGVIAAGDGDVPVSEAEREALERSGIQPSTLVNPKAHLGNSFAAAAAVQVGLAAELALKQAYVSR